MKRLLVFAFIVFSFLQLQSQNRVFIFLNSNPDKEVLSEEAVNELQAAHLKNIEKLADEGKLEIAGPFEGGGGIFVLNANDQFEAWNYLKTDPAIEANRFKIELLPFQTANGYVKKPAKPYEMVNYQFIRLISNPDFKGDATQLIHDNRIVMAKIFNENKDVLTYGFFSEYSDGMMVVDGTTERAEELISTHPSVQAGQLKYEIKTLYIAKGSFKR